MRRPRSARLALAGVLLLAAGACGSSTGTGAAEPGSTAARGPLTVFAAASLTEAFTDLQAVLKSSAPALAVTYSFGGSGALVAQIQQGAPADVVATADPATMQRLVDAGLVDDPTTFARNRLEILVAPGNPKHVAAVADLVRSDLKVVLADDGVPAGKYAAQALQAAGATVKPVSKEPDVKAAVAKVTLGEADATIVYATDVLAAGTKGQGVEIPSPANVVAEYPVAVTRSTKNPAGAAAFVGAVLSTPGQDALRQRGFSPAAGAH
jgi:molybdate transport system substrate-binding protein